MFCKPGNDKIGLFKVHIPAPRFNLICTFKLIAENNHTLLSDFQFGFSEIVFEMSSVWLEFMLRFLYELSH